MNDTQDFAGQFMGRIRENAGLSIGLGVFILLMGLVALASPVVAGLSVAMVVGVLLIVSGIAQKDFFKVFVVAHSSRPTHPPICKRQVRR